ncbi:hypothetical protein PAAG_11741 [Paracoccidioides lutzii Pb01]|uniref:Uncharacterized protein n=1 Tax=Paracoccidioides lutzii (strain ATCC MYA-826 / Pb01) TaxID=502779 RepID=A0A0A2V114_PARBA|nr:hypothetical protein PAAG_11741 [Paracoccidioides lutzii Pb01]KGQ01506.1 hypothetical protein PAAG_11741 [Paracoccidioides lutzii Pb01]
MFRICGQGYSASACRLDVTPETFSKVQSNVTTPVELTEWASSVDFRVCTLRENDYMENSHVKEVSDRNWCFQASRETTSTSSIPTNIESRIKGGRLTTIMVLYADKEAADGENIDWILSEVSRRNQQEDISFVATFTSLEME